MVNMALSAENPADTLRLLDIYIKKQLLEKYFFYKIVRKQILLKSI